MSEYISKGWMSLLYHFHRCLYWKYLHCNHDFYFSTKTICKEFGLTIKTSAYGKAVLMGIENGVLPVRIVNPRPRGILFHTCFREDE